MSKKSSFGNVLRRRKYVLDREVQFGVLLHVLGVLGGIAVLYALATLVFVSEEALAALTAKQMRHFLLVVNSVYFVLAAAILASLVVLLTHRFTGPVFVMRRAIAAMREGRFDERLELREKDYLKPLAADLRGLRSEVVARREAERRFVEELEGALERGDTAAAQEALARYRGERREAVAAVAPTRAAS